MKRYTVTCPSCGEDNYGLLLEETKGWMECERCGCVAWIQADDMEHAVPLYAVQEIKKIRVT